MKITKKNNLDERQEQALLHIEHNGCWIAFWGLLVVMAVQFIMYGAESWKSLAGEWIVFMVLSIYIAWGCEKEGIWDRRLKPDFRTNLVVSVIAGLVMTILTGLTFLMRFPGKPQGSFAVGAFFGIIVFVLCFFSLQLAAAKYRKKVKEQEEEPEDVDDLE